MMLDEESGQFPLVFGRASASIGGGEFINWDPHSLRSCGSSELQEDLGSVLVSSELNDSANNCFASKRTVLFEIISEWHFLRGGVYGWPIKSKVASVMVAKRSIPSTMFWGKYKKYHHGVKSECKSACGGMVLVETRKRVRL